MRDQLLAALAQYGSPALFVVAAIAAVGLPLPITLLLLVTGSLVSQGMMRPWWAVGAASLGSILGDQLGYALGRWGERALIAKLTGLLGGHERLERAHVYAKRWGGPGVFFTRWLIGVLGPWINLASGITGYPWVRFLFWDVLGEVFGVVLYVWLGRVFSDRVLELEALVGDLTGALIAGLAALLLGWKLWSFLRSRKAAVQVARLDAE